MAFLLVAPSRAAQRPSKNPPTNPARIHLRPRLQAGEVFRYQLDLHTDAATRAHGPISDPQGASHLERAAIVTVRVEVLRVDAGNASTRLRATYEHCSVASKSDALDVEEKEQEERFRKLEGISVEYTMDADGKTHDFAAFGEAASDPSTLLALQQGTGALSVAAGIPSAGVAIGDSWATEQEFQPSPLNGLYWRTESTYLRDEACPRPNISTDADAATTGQNDSNSQADPNSKDMCAVVQSKMSLLTRDTGGNQTPADYIKNGLRTSGTWTGSAESTSDISRATGLVVTMTQTGSQDMNFRIATGEGRAAMQFEGHVDDQIAVTQLP